MRFVPALSLLVTFIFTFSAAAQTTATDDEARLLFQAGQLAFENGEYQRALDAFERAHDLSHRSDLLYNIGLAADRLRRDDRALDAFRQYLVEVPNGPQRRQVEARIRILEATLAESASTSTSVAETRSEEPPTDRGPAPPETTDSESGASESGTHPALGLFVGAGVATAVTGAGAAYWANRASALSECRDANAATTVCANESTIVGQRSAAIAITVVGAVSVPVLIVGALVKRRNSRHDAERRVVAMCAPGGLGLACVGTF